MDRSSDEFKGQALTGNLNMFTSAQGKLVENLIESLDDVLGATKLGSLQTWPLFF